MFSCYCLLNLDTVTPDLLEAGLTAPKQATAESNLSQEGADDESKQPTEKKMKTLEEFLAEAPRISVGQRHTARFDCELNEWADGRALTGPHSWPPLLWLRLTRTGQGHDIKLISLDNTLITADRRFRAQRLSAGRWQLSLDNVQPDDSHAYFLCQVGAPGGACTGSMCLKRTFAGGALLTVLGKC